MFSKNKPSKIIFVIMMIIILVITIAASIIYIAKVFEESCREQSHEERGIYAYLNEEYGLQTSDLTLIEKKVANIKSYNKYDIYIYYFEINIIGRRFAVQDTYTDMGDAIPNYEYNLSDNYEDAVVAYITNTDYDEGLWAAEDWDCYEAPKLRYTFSCVEDLDVIFEDYSDKNEECIKHGFDVSELAWHTEVFYAKTDPTIDSNNNDAEKLFFIGNPYYDENGGINHDRRMVFTGDA